MTCVDPREDGPALRRALGVARTALGRVRGRVAQRRAGRGAVGYVWLVGAGPGSADLMTVRASRVLESARVVVHDRLVSPEILAIAPRGAQRVDVGKRRGHHRMTQPEINALLVRLAREGQRVVRLKGGDPLVFGRGGEEAQALACAGIGFEIVPGVTAASACAASALIPLTHRGVSSSCLFLTGYSQRGGPDLDWPVLARSEHTLAIYMGLHTLHRIVAGLVTHGRGADTPAALVERGGTPRQRVISATLGTLVARARSEQAAGPALLIIGDVVALRPVLLGLAAPLRAAGLPPVDVAA